MKILVAERIRELMKERSLNQIQLAQNLGVTQGMVSAWVLGKKLPSISNLWMLADYFGVDIDYLIGRNND